MTYNLFNRTKTKSQRLLAALTLCALPLSMANQANALSFIDQLPALVDSGLAFENGDAISFSYQLLAHPSVGVIDSSEIPFTPQGTSPFIRVFTRNNVLSNAHLNPNINDAFRRQTGIVFDQDGDEAPSTEDQEFNFNHFNPSPPSTPPTPAITDNPTSRLYWGATWFNSNDALIESKNSSITSESDYLVTAPTAGAPSPFVTGADLSTWLGDNVPIFALDFSQRGSEFEADLWIKARGILIDQTAFHLELPNVDANQDGNTQPAELDQLIANLLGTPNGTAFSIFDSYNADPLSLDKDTDEDWDGNTTLGDPKFGLDIDPTSPVNSMNFNPTDDDFVLTPKVLQGINIDGSSTDWGAVFPDLNFADFPNHYFFIEWQEKNANNGIDDIYILPGTTEIGFIPTPSAALAGALGFGLIATFRRKRKSA